MATPQLSWMVIGADTAPELATAKTNGATHGLVEVYWDQVQTTSGGAVDATGVVAAIQRVRDAGLKVCLRANLQYIPTFVDTAAVKFRRNGAVDYNPGNVSGNNARDWVWSAATRALVDDYLTKLFAQLNWSHIDRVQLGGGPSGELQYPDSDGTQWWGFSAPAQTGTGLASGQTVCPVPGHVPSTGTTWTANDISFATWYTQSLTNWMLWLIAKHRSYFTGPIWVMHPGAGLRKTSQTPTGGQALNYRVNLGKGVDWDHQIAAYPDAQVHPYCTWADSDHFAGSPFSDVNDGDAAPWYHLLRIARNRGRAAQIWGENTGGQSNTDMDRVFTSGSVAHGYQGLTWLSHDSLADGTSDTYANWATRIATANAAYANYSRGVNMAGGEFAPAAATLPGTYGTDYSYDGATAFTAIAARGHDIVRVPFRWERIQPTRNAALNVTELTRLQGVVANIQAAGMRAVLDCHNYARYINSVSNGGAELVLNTTLPIADLVDLWTRLSAAFKGNTGIYAYGLMNEPHDLVSVAGSFSGTVRYDWASGVQGWTGDSATASNVSGQLRLTASLGSGSVNMRKDDAATVSGGATPTGSVVRVKATPVALPAGTWSAKAQWQNSSFAWQNPTSVVMTRVDTGAVVTSLTVGQAVYVTSTFSSITSPPTAFALQVDGSGATAGTVTIDFDDFAQGSLSGALTPAQVWESASQQIVTAVRNNNDTTRILVSGYNWSGAKNWKTTHASPWITDTASNTAYEAHYYFDSDNSGDYPDSYGTENTAATGAGYANLATRAVTELQNWTTWLVANGVRGLLGEIGWPNTADTASWNAVGEAIYDECDLHAVDVTYWSAGARWGSGYNLSIYTGTNQDTVKSPATTVEAHPSSSGGGVAVPVTFRGATEDARGTSNSPIVALPTGVVEGDLLICVQTCDINGSSGAMLAPSGWAQIGLFSRSDVGFMKVWRKTATDSEPADYTFVDESDSQGGAIILAVTDQDAGAPLAVSPTFASGAATTAHPAPSVAGVAGGLLVTAHQAGTAGTTRSYTPPTGMIQRQQSELSTDSNYLLEVNTQSLTVLGQTGAKSATCSASTPYITMSLVVAPVTAVVAATPDSADATGRALNATVRSSSRATPGPGSATGQANNATAGLLSRTTVTPATAGATGRASQPSIGSGSASGTTVQVAAPASARGTAQQPTTTPSATPGLYPGAGVFPGSDLYPGTGYAGTVAVNSTATAYGSAANPTVRTQSVNRSTVNAGTAGATAAANGVGSTGFVATTESVTALFPSETLFPSEGLFPTDGGTPTVKIVSPAGIASSEQFGSPIVSLADGEQIVVVTSIDSTEAFGVPTVETAIGPQDVTDVGGIGTAEAVGRPTFSVDVGPPPPQPNQGYFDTYFIDGIDLSSFTTQIEVAEGLQDSPGTVGANIDLPGRDGVLEVYGAPGQQRRPDGVGRLTLNMWLIGVDPISGAELDDAGSAQAYMQRWDELVRLFHRRRITIDHPRPDGTRRAVGHLVPGESMAPSSRSASPWFGRFSAAITIPAAHWVDTAPVTTGPTTLTNNGVLSLSVFTGATAPCTELVITFGPGNNPKLSTSYGQVGWNGVIAAGRELTIDTVTGELGYGAGQPWSPTYEGLVFAPGPRLFEVDPAESLQAILTHTGGGSMSVEVSGTRRYRTS